MLLAGTLLAEQAQQATKGNNELVQMTVVPNMTLLVQLIYASVARGGFDALRVSKLCFNNFSPPLVRADRPSVARP